MADLKKLHSKRSIAAGRITEVYRCALKAKEDPNLIDLFRVKYSDLKDLYDTFCEIHNSVIMLINSDEDFETEDKIRQDIDYYYYESKLYYHKICKPLDDLATANARAAETAARSVPISDFNKLPPLNVPIFKGDQKLWRMFIDLFNQIVHTNSSISNGAKFKYLLSYLEDEPLKLLSGIQISDDNYLIAYEKLVKRYQNKRLLASAALNSIMAVTIKNESAKEFRLLLNTFSESLASLKALELNTDQWDFILFHLLLEKLDVNTRTSFEIHCSAEEIPTFSQLFDFLENRCRALESVQHLNAPKVNKVAQNISFRNSNFSKGYSKPNTQSFSLQVSDGSSNIKCYLCKEPHVISRCQNFLEKTPSERCAYAKQNKLCVNCLHHSHNVQKCTSSYRCRTCRGKHHSILHIPSSSRNSSDVPTSSNIIQNSTSQSNFSTPTTRQNTSPTISANTYASESTVLLATAIVDISDSNGNFHPIRVLLDSGGQAHFITVKCLRRLSLPRQPFLTSIYGLNNMSSISSKGIAHLVIKPKNISGPLFSLDAIVVSNVCSDLPSFDIQHSEWDHLKGLNLADERYYRSSPVDLIIGAELFTHILKKGRLIGEVGQPTAFETIFGWVLLGKINNCSSSSVVSNPSSFLISSQPPLETILTKFWEIENVPSKTFLSPEDIKAEEIFKNTVTRDNTGRFIVALPFRHSEPDLGDTYPQAFRRFSMLESRLQKNPQLYAAYSDFMRDYIDSGHMSLVTPETPKPQYSCYLPHHCVLKPESVSTKLRVVWDGSAKGPKGLSLNDTLLSGPKLQKDICSLLLVFRLHPVVFIADIKQMFRQVLVTPAHRNFQKILWRFSPDESLSEWTLNTVTFGLSCSPYLAMRILNELADLEQSRFPQASRLLKTQVYIDDILGTSPSVSSALSLQRELIELLKLGHFELRKWASNCQELLAAVRNSDRQMPLSFDKDEPHFLKVLGLQWHPYSDCFTYKCQTNDKTCTKRSILSDISRIFDPLGYLSPVILSAKYMMQQLWKLQLDWDTPIPQNLRDSWTQLKLELPELSKLSLSRRVLVDNYTRCELHGFCDSSMIGYGAVIFFRVETKNTTSIFLVCAKSRVAPVKTVSLPKLELTAAKLLSDLISFVRVTYSGEIVFDETFAWSDSQVVLAWLNSLPSRWKTFVANRVSHIQEIVPPTSWHYIPSDLNPADCASRGLTPTKLLGHDLWWNGPPFLSLPREEWYNNSFLKQPDEQNSDIIYSEEKQVVLTLTVETHLLDKLLDKFSALSKIQRILSLVMRVFTNFRTKILSLNKVVGNPTSDELQESLMRLIKHVQRTKFPDIISKIEENKLLPKPLRKLALFLDSEGFLRAGGRLRIADLPFRTKHPLLLPSCHRLTTLIIEHYHKQYLHPGMRTLHNLLLQQFWILSARRAIQKVLSSCLRCFKIRPKSYAPPIMGDLPLHRISQIKPFSYVAIDFCGPFFITMIRSRGAKTYKSYVCVFVCTSTKAIHLELAQNLSTDCFIAAFRRFIARRGSIVSCHSDNGTNFIGAHNQFLELARQASEKLSFRWTHSPPLGSHFNGLAEAGVKSVKSHLLRVVGDQLLSYEEMTTILCQIEAVLNSRPLCSQSSDPNDLVPLTPAHFLTLHPLVPVIPEPDLSHIQINRLSRWQLIQKLVADFWKRYFFEYLNTLQQRSKWISPVKEIKLNDLVLLKNDAQPPLKWPLGRVTQLYPGDDGHIRVVSVKTANGEFRRPVVKLCGLPEC